MLHIKHNILIVNMHRRLTVDGTVKGFLKKAESFIHSFFLSFFLSVVCLTMGV